MIREDKKVKSVFFNLTDPDELADFEHAGKRENFSAYVRRLITLDRLGGQLAVLQGDADRQMPEIPQQVKDDNSKDVVQNSAEGFL